MTMNAVAIRRRDISAYIADHPNVELSDRTVIADALGLDKEIVSNDIAFLRGKLQESYSQYGLEGLRDKASNHIKELKELQKLAHDLRDNDDLDVRLKAIDTELKLIHNIYQLENDGIGVLTEEINYGLEDKEK